MNSKAMSIKGKIKNRAKEKNVTAQVILQNYMFERFLVRLSNSEYKDRFVLKGGMLVSAILGIDTRSTMDLDATLRQIPLSEENIRKVVLDICSIPMDDDVTFNFVSITPIRADDVYGGFCARFDANLETISVSLSIDFSTGDVITPHPVLCSIDSVFDDDLHIELWTYNIETILAEKVETVLRRGVLNTRSKDFYDIYVLCNTQTYDKGIFKEALAATATHRGSTQQIDNISKILETIKSSRALRLQWEKYKKTFPYASDISFDQIVDTLTDITGS